jgi:hypothetical protein
LPRLICLKESDQEFLVDLSNALAVDSLVAHMEPNGDTTFVEMFPGEADLCCHGPEGRFVHEILMPFVREGKATQAVTTSTRVANSCVRTFPPGSEWVYAKLYTGTAAADLVLCDSLAPLVDTLVQSGVIDRWFFLRYRDPGWHIRIRFHLVDRHQHTRVVGALQELFASEARACRASRLQLDTYDREVERYGGVKDSSTLTVSPVWRFCRSSGVKDYWVPMSAGACYSLGWLVSLTILVSTSKPKFPWSRRLVIDFKASTGWVRSCALQLESASAVSDLSWRP